MRIFDFFRNNNKTVSDSNKPKIEFGFRGEDITYHLQGKEVYISFTWCNGNRVYPDSITKWEDGTFLTNEEKERIFTDVLHYTKKTRGKLIVVINKDDTSKNIWEHICSVNKSIVDEIEYTSDEENYQFLRNSDLNYIKNGGKLTIDGIKIKSEQDLDEAMQKFQVRSDE